MKVILPCPCPEVAVLCVDLLFVEPVLVWAWDVEVWAVGSPTAIGTIYYWEKIKDIFNYFVYRFFNQILSDMGYHNWFKTR